MTAVRETRKPCIGLIIGQLSHGGAEHQATILAKALAKQGDYRPVVFCMSDATEPYGSILSAAGVEWHSPPARTRSRLWRLLWLIRQIAGSRCSLVYGVLNTGNIYGGVAALMCGLPFVGSIRNADTQ